MPRFSIIVPVYNSERYLRECLDSILAQSFNDYEVLMVDDGSTDSSRGICEEYAEKDPRFKVISQTNSGTSAARNTGLASAVGEYVTFMDNDDFWLSPDALKAMDDVADETCSDLIFHESVIFDSDSGKLATPTQPKGVAEALSRCGKSEAIATLLKRNLLNVTVWSMACKRELINDHDLLFPTGMRNEDTYWLGLALLWAKSIAWCDLSFYAYRKNHESAQTSHPLKIRHIEDLADICRELSVQIEAADIPEDEKTALYGYLSYPYLVLLGQSGLLTPGQYKGSVIEKEVVSRKWLLEYVPNVFRGRALRAGNTLFGINALRKGLSLVLKARYPRLIIEP